MDNDNNKNDNINSNTINDTTDINVNISGKKRKSNSLDDIIGEKVRLLRRKVHMPQRELGEAVGITLQQIQKYETGKNRISVGTLYEMAHYFEVEIGYFFEDIENENSSTADLTKRKVNIIKKENIKIKSDNIEKNDEEKIREYLESNKRLKSYILELIKEEER